MTRHPPSDRSTDPDKRATGEVGRHVVGQAPKCDLCGGAMIDRHCKLVCATCGYQRDCSDP